MDYINDMGSSKAAHRPGGTGNPDWINIMQRTLHLEANVFSLTSDGLVMAWRFKDDSSDSYDDMESVETRYKIGARAVLKSTTNVSPDAIRAGRDVPRFSLCWDLDGVPCNGNPKMRIENGWCGTTNDWSVYAHGLCTIKTIRVLRDGTVAVTVITDE